MAPQAGQREPPPKVLRARFSDFTLAGTLADTPTGNPPPLVNHVLLLVS